MPLGQLSCVKVELRRRLREFQCAPAATSSHELPLQVFYTAEAAPLLMFRWTLTSEIAARMLRVVRRIEL